MFKNIAVSLGSGLVIGAMGTVLAPLQFWCFVLGIVLFNYAYFEPKYLAKALAKFQSKKIEQS